MRKSISLVLTLGMLCSSLSPVYSRVDAKLEAEIKKDYQAFTGKPIKELAIQPSKAVQFVYELQEKLQKTHDKRIAEKIAAIISEGAGVGGVDANRQATEDEKKILTSSLCFAFDAGAKIDNPTLNDSLGFKDFSYMDHKEFTYSIFKLISDNIDNWKFRFSWSIKDGWKPAPTLIEAVLKIFKMRKVKNDPLYAEIIKDGNKEEIDRSLEYYAPLDNIHRFLDQTLEMQKIRNEQKNSSSTISFGNNDVNDRQWIIDKLHLFLESGVQDGAYSLISSLERIIKNRKYIDNTQELLVNFFKHPKLDRATKKSAGFLLGYLYDYHPLDSEYCLTSILRFLDITPGNIYVNSDDLKLLIEKKNQIDSIFNQFTRVLPDLTNVNSATNFKEIFRIIAKIPPEQLEQRITQTLQLIEPADSLSYRYTKLRSIEGHTNREEFLTFLVNNQVTNSAHIVQLSQVPNPADWEATLQGLRAAGRNDYQIQGIANQTVHDTAYETSITDALKKLETRYKDSNKEDLETILLLYQSKIDDLEKKKLLTSTEAEIARYFFTDGFERISNNGNEDKITRYLNLVLIALNDKLSGRDLESKKADFTDQDIDDRFEGWLKAGPIDAQLAYKLDNLGSGSPYKNKVDLLKAIEKDKTIITSGQSCVGGSYNRLIDALNLIHPDVKLVTGEGNLKNIDLMNRVNFLKKRSVALLKDIYEEDTDRFNNLDELKKNVKKELEKDFEEELKKNHPTMNMPQVRAQEIDNFFNNDFTDAMRQVTILAPVYEYIDAPLPSAGLTKDVKQKLGDIKKLSFRTLEESIKEHVKALATSKLQALTTFPSDKEKTSGLTYALEQTEIIGLSVRKDMIKHRVEGMEANIKQIAKEFKETEPKIVEQIKADINQYNKSNPDKKKPIDLTFLNTFSYFIQKTIQQKEEVKVEIGEIQQVWRNFMNKDTFKPLK